MLNELFQGFFQHHKMENGHDFSPLYSLLILNQKIQNYKKIEFDTPYALHV